MKIKYKEYLHSEKDSNFEKAEELDLSKKATDEFIYSLYEVTFDDMEVETETGETWILGIGGVELKEPVRAQGD